MKMSGLFGRTLRDAPANMDEPGLQLLVRAGMIRVVAGGVFAVLPLGMRIVRRMETRVAAGLAEMGGQEILLPQVHSSELHQTGAVRPVLADTTEFSDLLGRQYVLGPQGAVVLAALAGPEVRSYRQLPALLYARRQAWQDASGPGRLLEARESIVVESFGLAPDDVTAQAQLDGHDRLYSALLHAAGLPTVRVFASPRQGGDEQALEQNLGYVYLSPLAGQTLLHCDHCDYAALTEAAAFTRPARDDEPLRPVEKVATPDTKTIAALAAFLGVPESKTAKAVFLVATVGSEERFVFAVIRGDLDVNPTKLAGVVGTSRLRQATESEIRAVGATPGYASPVGLRNVMVIADYSVVDSPNLVAGANDEGYHLLNTNLGRDYDATVVTDIALAQPGMPCPRCSGTLDGITGAVIAHLSRAYYRGAPGDQPSYLNAQGRNAAVILTAYRLDLLRLLAAAAEVHRDEQGFLWPPAIAPFDVHLVALGGGEAEAETLYETLRQAGLDVLFDDRNDSPGVKFADADLIGVPVRLTIGKRSLQQGGVELKARDQADRRLVALGNVLAEVKAELLACEARQPEREK